MGGALYSEIDSAERTIKPILRAPLCEFGGPMRDTEDVSRAQKSDGSRRR